jgi:hypothetical protein
MMSLALLVAAIFFCVCISGPLAAVAAIHGRPILAVFCGVTAMAAGTHWYSATMAPVSLVGLASAACGAYALFRVVKVVD